MAWMKAMPITPWATARMVATDSTVNSSPRSGPTMRPKIARLARSPASPKAITMPAMMKAATNLRMSPPMAATIANAVFARSPIFGCRLAISAGRSVWALSQTAKILSPTSGQSATRASGGGICSVFCCTSSISRCTESPTEFTSTAVGATISVMPSSVISVAAQPLRASQPTGQGLGSADTA